METNSKIEKLKKDIELLPVEERKELYKQLQVIENETIVGLLEFDDHSVTGRERPKVTFVHYKDSKKESTIDIYAEIKADFRNIRKPEIWACIERWAKAIRYQHIIPKEDYKISKKNLSRVVEKFLESINSKDQIIPKEIAMSLSINNYESELLEKMWGCFADPNVKSETDTQRKLDLIYKKCSIVLDRGQGIKFTGDVKFNQLMEIIGSVRDNVGKQGDFQQYPSPEYLFYFMERTEYIVDFMEFISSDDSYRFGYRDSTNFSLMGWESFKNAFITWKTNEILHPQKAKDTIKKDTIKEYLSSSKRILSNYSSSQLDKLKSDNLAKYGSIMDIGKPLGSNKMYVKIYPHIEKLEILEDINLTSYTP